MSMNRIIPQLHIKGPMVVKPIHTEALRIVGEPIELAKRYYRDGADEIIFLDINMPIMDGWQFLEEYIKLNPKIGKKIVIYICSSSISPDDINKAKEISAVTDYIIKPVSKDMLAEILTKLIV